MENFSTVLWIVVIAAAMIFNVVSQSRKQAKKQARQAGDSAVLEDSDSSNYYVVVFNGRSRNEYNTVNVRHILIQPEASELSEADEGYELSLIHI